MLVVSAKIFGGTRFSSSLSHVFSLLRVIPLFLYFEVGSGWHNSSISAKVERVTNGIPRGHNNSQNKCGEF